MCIDVDVDKNVKHKHRQKYHEKGALNEIFCTIPGYASGNLQVKTVTPPPPQIHTFLKWPFLTDFKKYAHAPLPPQCDDMLAH